MPVDIYDRNQEHIGIIRERYIDTDNVYMVAITDLNSADIAIDEDKLKKYMAGIVKVKSIFGKIDEDRLKEEIEELRISEQYEQLSYDDFIKYLFLKNYSGKSIENYLEINGFREELIKGYILLDIKKIEIKNGKLCIDDEMDYILNETIDYDLIPKNNSPYLIDQRKDEITDKIKPIFAKITGYPILQTDIMGFGEGFILGGDLADLGGRNHSHETILRIKSGSYEDNIVLPIIVFAKAGMPIQLYIDEKKIEKVFCDGVIYKLWQ